jgi:hypothetical protein
MTTTMPLDLSDPVLRAALWLTVGPVVLGLVVWILRRIATRWVRRRADRDGR